MDIFLQMSRVAYINQRIQKEKCLETIEKLKDNALLEVYKGLPSVQNNIDNLKKVLGNNNISNEVQNSIINDYIPELIPPGTKGVIRGNKFNEIVEEYITNIFKEYAHRFEVKTEIKHPLFPTDEIPDWYVYDKEKNKIIIGMNQLDLWGGGQQLNRGSKYLISSPYNTENSKLVCVVNNEIDLKSDKNKVYSLFDIGFQNNTLCYLKGLPRIFIKYFF